MNNKIKELCISLGVTVVLCFVLFLYIDKNHRDLDEFATMLAWFPKLLGILLLVTSLVRMFRSSESFSDFEANKGSLFLIFIGFGCIHWSGVIALALYVIADKFTTHRSKP